MSKAKFAAAKELIDEKRYDEARVILRTIDHPTAYKWLAKIDQLQPRVPVAPAPPPPPMPRASYSSRPLISPEQEAYYSRENRKARRRAIRNGIELVGAGLVCFGAFVLFALPTRNFQTGITASNPGIAWLFIPLGIIGVVVGLRRMRG